MIAELESPSGSVGLAGLAFGLERHQECAVVGGDEDLEQSELELG